MEELYIPNCCIHRQLPDLIPTSPTTYFYSRSDWGIPKLWDAVSRLVERNGPDILTILVTDTVDVYLLRYIAQSMRIDHIHALVMITSTDQTDLVSTELKDFTTRLWYAPLKDAASRNNLWIRLSPRASLIINGPMYKDEHGSRSGEMSSYVATYSNKDLRHDHPCHADYNLLLARCVQAFRPWRSQCRLHATIKGSDPLFHPLLT